MNLKNIKVINNTVRNMKLAQDFNNILTMNEEQQSNVLQCIQVHRYSFLNTIKETLNKNVLM